MKRVEKRVPLNTRDRLFWDRLGARVAQLAPGLVFPAKPGGPLAARLASPPMDSAVETSTAGPSNDRSADPRPGSRDGHCEPVMGSAADLWGVADTRRRPFRAHGVASA